MAQKGRNDLTSVVSSNLFDNNNKEILASMLRTVFTDFNDSKFNLNDDELKNVTYKIDGETKITLQEFLNNVIGAIPLWGSTDYFDIGPNTQTVSNYSNKGIVTDVTYSSAGNHDCELTINLSKNISTRKLAISIHTDSSNFHTQNDICTPVIRVINGQLIKVALREVTGNQQRIRLEILAHKVSS